MRLLVLFVQSFLLLLFFNVNVDAQGQCGTSFLKTIGNGNEIGFTVAYSQIENVVYACGTTHDSVIIVRLDQDFNIDWIRKLDIIPGRPEYVNGMIVDKDGKIAIAGTIATLENEGYGFICRYDPQSNTTMWSREVRGSLDGVCSALIELPDADQYLFSYNPNSPNNAQLFLFDATTGAIQSQFSKEYGLGSSETISDIVYYNGTLYGVGRFTDGPSTAEMRTTLISLDPLTGMPGYTLLGHKPASTNARLYGFDLVIDQDTIYYVSCGNESSASISDTKVYVQKATLDGQIIWLKEYNFPGQNDWVNEIVKTGDGFAILGSNRIAPSYIIIFKINKAGDVLWGRKFDRDQNDNTVSVGGVSSQMVAVGDEIIFTAYSEQSGSYNMIIGGLSTDGDIKDDCDIIETIDIPVREVKNKTYYFVNTEVGDETPLLLTPTPQTAIDIDLEEENSCVNGTVQTQIEATICSGSSFEGYDHTGIYQDTFASIDGCDSIRQLMIRAIDCKGIVSYNLNACASFMSNGSHMDYSEFIPEYPNPLICGAVSATNIFRDPPQMNKHSCTPGVNNSIAMCISANTSCTYLPGDAASLVFELNIIPAADSVIQISGLNFFEKAPAMYSWISGPSGPNNYPKFYGIRILKNGTEIFRQKDIPTNQSWTEQAYDFVDLEALRISEPSLIRFELLPYCPIGNGAPVSAWDIDEISISAGCWPVQISQPFISGVVTAMDGRKMRNVAIDLSTKVGFSNAERVLTDNEGNYHVDHLNTGTSYYLKGSYTDELLNGVNTFDLLTIQKHLLGIETFTHADQFIAADVNHNASITAMDILELRKALLGKINSFPNNTSWQIGWFDENNAWKGIQSAEAIQEKTVFNWNGIKIGDLNHDAVVNVTEDNLYSRTDKSFELGYPDQQVIEGEKIEVTLKTLSENDLEGFQFVLRAEDLEMTEAIGRSIDFNTEHYQLHDDGLIWFSWSNANSTHLVKNADFISLKFTAKRNGRLGEMLQVMDHPLLPQAYFGNETTNLELKNLSRKDHTPNIIGGIRIHPNPFAESTKIELDMIEAGIVKFAFYDLSGQLIFKFEKVLETGKQQVEIGRKELESSSCIMACQVVCQSQVITEKVVMMH